MLPHAFTTNAEAQGCSKSRCQSRDRLVRERFRTSGRAKDSRRNSAMRRCAPWVDGATGAWVTGAVGRSGRDRGRDRATSATGATRATAATGQCRDGARSSGLRQIELHPRIGRDEIQVFGVT